MKLSAGSLRHSITIQRHTETQNDFGEVIKDWSVLLTTQSRIRPISGKELFANHATINTLTHAVYIRYQVSIKPYDRVIFKNREFNIVSVINHDEKNISLELMCLELY